MASVTDVPQQLSRCPVCEGETFEQRYWFAFLRGAVLRRWAPWGRAPKNSVEWFVCSECGHVLSFMRR